MRSLLNLLRQKEPESAALAKALADIPRAATKAKLGELQANRRQLLLEAVDDDIVEAVEREIAATLREIDRQAVFAEELRLKIVTAEKRERLEALVALKGETEAECRGVVAAMDRDARRMLDELLALLARNRSAFSEANRVDRLLAEAGLSERIVADRRSSNGGLSDWEMGQLDNLQPPGALAII